MQERAKQILDAVAVEIEPTAEPKLAALLDRVRAEAAAPRRWAGSRSSTSFNRPAWLLPGRDF
jgi:hypothetical protein